MNQFKYTFNNFFLSHKQGTSLSNDLFFEGEVSKNIIYVNTDEKTTMTCAYMLEFTAIKLG